MCKSRPVPINPEKMGDNIYGISSHVSFIDHLDIGLSLGVTVLLLSLVLSVAALWIPWQRFDMMDRDIRQLEMKYESLQELINNTW